MLTIVYGTRPEYLKVLPLITHLASVSVIRVLQHKDMDEPDLKYDNKIVIDDSNNRLDSLGSQILLKLSSVFQQLNTSQLLVQGDTATAFYSALCAFQNRIPVIHLEAGLRTYDLENPYPEEAYRQMISRIASVHLVPHEYNKTLLEQEKVSGKIVCVGNTILDLVKSYNLTVSCGNTILITFHRRENLQYLESFVSNLKQCIHANPTREFVWFLHPNPVLQERVKTITHGMKIRFVSPCAHREFLEHVKDCFCILTDSGGIQEEAAFLGKPTIVLREKTERDQIPLPYLTMVRPPYDYLKDVLSSIPTHQLEPCFVYGDGMTTDRVLNILNQ